MGKNYVDVRLSGSVDTSTGGFVLNTKDRKRDVHIIYSQHTTRTTVSSTRHDTYGYGVNSILFITDGALTSVTATNMALSTNLSSGTTFAAGTTLYLNDASKVKLTSHGSQLIFLNG